MVLLLFDALCFLHVNAEKNSHHVEGNIYFNFSKPELVGLLLCNINTGLCLKKKVMAFSLIKFKQGFYR